MKNYVNLLTGNMVLNVSIIAWFIAQVLKVIVVLLHKRRLDFSLLLGSGGMPSSHAATVCACAASTGVMAGWSSFSFAIAAVVAFVVMYDAANVRKEAGEQAKILNYMMDNWGKMPPDLFGRKLKELLGHTPIQVFAGAVLGITVGLIIPTLWR